MRSFRRFIAITIALIMLILSFAFRVLVFIFELCYICTPHLSRRAYHRIMQGKIFRD